MDIKEQVEKNILYNMMGSLNEEQLKKLEDTITMTFNDIDMKKSCTALSYIDDFNNFAVRQYIATLRIENKSEKTIERYKLVIDMMLADIDKDIKDITFYDLKNYLAKYKIKRKVSGTTLDGIRRCINAFFTWLEVNDFIEKSPAKKLTKIKNDTQPEPEFTGAEMEKIMLACKYDRDKALIKFMYETGARVSEVVNVKLSDINFENMTVVLHGKGNKDRVSIFTDVALLYIKRYLSSRKINSEYLFAGLRGQEKITKNAVGRLLKHAADIAGVENVHPHRYRVTRITVLAKRGMPLQDIQELVGHNTISTTQGYCRRNNQKIYAQYQMLS